MLRSFLYLALIVVPVPWSQSSSQTQQGTPPPASSTQNPASPQLQPRPAQPANPATPENNRQITLEVQVNAKPGAPIRGLQKQDFTLLDDRQPQTILSFQSVDRAHATPADPPAEVVLLIDAVNAGFNSVGFARDQIKRFLLQNNGQLPEPVSLIVLTDAGAQAQNGASRDGKALAVMYDQIETGLRTSTRAQGFYGATDRFQMSLKALHELTAYESARPGRKFVIWISPGWPLITGPNIELTNRDQRELFNSIVNFSTELRHAGITLYNIDSLGLADAGTVRITYYEEFLKGVTAPSKTQPANLSLQVLAVQSGGKVLNSTNDITSAINNCVSDTESYYVISFTAPRADHPDEYHSLEVKVDRPKVTARTRTGYYAQP